MDDILLTYIVPVYNTEAFVLRCLQSIVEQGIGEGDYEVTIAGQLLKISSVPIIKYA